jgi:flagellar protein FliO/FliZ
MIKLNAFPRAAATAAATLGPCLLALAAPASALGAARAAQGGESTPLNLSPSSSGSHASGGGASIVRTIVGLAIVIAVIWGLAWILRQVRAGRDPHVSSDGLASVAALTLSSGRSVHLVRAGNEYVLLGSAEHGVVPIRRYTEQEAREAGLLTAEQPRQRTRRPLLRPPAEPGDRRAGSRTERPDPMRPRSPLADLIDRLREWTVRR